MKFSIGLEAGVPVGGFSDASSFGIGATLQAEHGLSDDAAVTLSAGYLNFFGKSVNLSGYGTYKVPATSIVPLLAGVKYYFSKSFYGHVQAGVSFFNNGGGSAFTYAPSIGFVPSEYFDIAFKYQAASKSGSTLSFIGLRAAYNF